MVKLYENIYRSINIGLANEMKLICNRMGLNVFEVIKASTKPFGFSAFFPDLVMAVTVFQLILLPVVKSKVWL